MLMDTNINITGSEADPRPSSRRLLVDPGFCSHNAACDCYAISTP